MSDDLGATVPADDWSGRQLGRCKLQRKVGEGGMGAVYLAHHTGLDIPVAVKILPPAYASRDEWRARFVREARMAARLEHAHAVRVYDVDDEPTAPYLVMEFVDGASLGDRLQAEGPLPWREATRAIRQAAEALAAAHALGLIHRDIKPDNLMQAASGEVKVADFGLARETSGSELTRTGAISGSPAYMSPEQAEGQQLDGATDVYSLGVTFHALLTGRSAFTRDSLLATLRAVCEEPLPALPEALPSALGKLLERLCAKQPSQRPSMAEALALLRKIEGAQAAPRAAAAPARKKKPRPSGVAAGPKRASRRAAAEPGKASGPPLAIIGGAVGLAVLLVAAALGGAFGGGTSSASSASSLASASSADSSSALASSSQPSSAAGRPWAQVAPQLQGLAPADAQAVVEAYLAGEPGPVDRKLAEAHLRLLRGKQSLQQAAGTLREHIAAGELVAAQRLLTELGEQLGEAPGAELGGLLAILRGRLREAVVKAFDARRAQLEGQLRERRSAEVSKTIAELEGWPLSDEQRRQLAALRRAAEALAGPTATFEDALARAHAAIDASDRQLKQALGALARLEGQARWAEDRRRHAADPRLVELRALAALLRARDEALQAMVGKQVVGLGNPLTVRAVLADGIKVADPAGHESLIPWSRVPWAAQADWAAHALDATGYRVLGPALWALGQPKAAGDYLRKVTDADRELLAWMERREIARAEAPRPPTRLRPLVGKPLASPPTATLTAIEAIKLSSKARQRADERAAADGDRVVDGYALTPRQQAGALAERWRLKLGSRVTALAHVRQLGRVLVGTAKGRVAIVDLRRGRLKDLPAREHPITAIAGGYKGTVVVASGPSGKQLFVSTRSGWTRIYDHPAPVWRVVGYRDGRTFAVCGHKAVGLLRQVNAKDFHKLAEMKTSSYIEDLAWRHDSPVLIGLARQPAGLLAWDTQGRELWKSEPVEGPAYGMVITADHRAVVALDKRRMPTWQLAGKGKPRSPGAPARLDTLSIRIGAASMATDGRLLAIGEDSGRVLLYDPRTMAPLRLWQAHRDMEGPAGRPSLHPLVMTDDGELISGGTDGSVACWSPALAGDPADQLDAGGKAMPPGLYAGSLTRRWAASTRSQVTALAIEPVAGWVAFGCKGGEVLFHALADGSLVGGAGGSSEVIALAVEPRTRRLVVARADGSISVREPERWVECYRDPRAPARALAFAAKGRGLWISTPRGAALLDTEGERWTRLQEVVTGPEAPFTLAVRPQARTTELALSVGKRVSRWRLGEPKPIWTDDEDIREVCRQPVVYTRDGLRLVVGGYRKTLNVLDVASGRWLHQIPLHGGWADELSLDPGGRLLAVSATDNYMAPIRGWVMCFDTTSWREVGRLRCFPGDALTNLQAFRGGLVAVAGKDVSCWIARPPRPAK